jgi:hypothetical protein
MAQIKEGSGREIVRGREKTGIENGTPRGVIFLHVVILASVFSFHRCSWSCSSQQQHCGLVTVDTVRDNFLNVAR